MPDPQGYAERRQMGRDAIRTLTFLAELDIGAVENAPAEVDARLTAAGVLMLTAAAHLDACGALERDQNTLDLLETLGGELVLRRCGEPTRSPGVQGYRSRQTMQGVQAIEEDAEMAIRW